MMRVKWSSAWRISHAQWSNVTRRAYDRSELAFRSSQTGSQARAQNPADNRHAQRIERPFCISAVVSHKDHVVWVVPALTPHCLACVTDVPDLKASNVLCTASDRSYKQKSWRSRATAGGLSMKPPSMLPASQMQAMHCIHGLKQHAAANHACLRSFLFFALP